jgi:hypothetical protein
MDTDALMDAAVLLRQAAEGLRDGNLHAAADNLDAQAHLLELIAIQALEVLS